MMPRFGYDTTEQSIARELDRNGRNADVFVDRNCEDGGWQIHAGRYGHCGFSTRRDAEDTLKRARELARGSSR